MGLIHFLSHPKLILCKVLDHPLQNFAGHSPYGAQAVVFGEKVFRSQNNEQSFVLVVIPLHRFFPLFQ